ncbi:MAG: hypothetical protein LBQ02_00270 [Candidatus Nomurabacteria bacterium]|jgi:hypothetical protein|nr:hypothetical protein [Candidatus Nomurabacteria bacterium]
MIQVLMRVVVNLAVVPLFLAISTILVPIFGLKRQDWLDKLLSKSMIVVEAKKILQAFVLIYGPAVALGLVAQLLASNYQLVTFVGMLGWYLLAAICVFIKQGNHNPNSAMNISGTIIKKGSLAISICAFVGLIVLSKFATFLDALDTPHVLSLIIYTLANHGLVCLLVNDTPRKLLRKAKDLIKSVRAKTAVQPSALYHSSHRH